MEMTLRNLSSPAGIDHADFLARADLTFHPLERRSQHVFLPFLLPHGLESHSSWVWNAFHRSRRTGVLIRRGAIRASCPLGGDYPTSAETLAPLVGDAPARQLHEPGAERAVCRAHFERADVLGHRDDGFLHHLLRLGV